jgi:glycosyltransferase involved in cell wall biosynthesis
MKVGYIRDSYAWRRNIIGIVDKAEYKKVCDLFSILTAVTYPINIITKRDLFSTNDLINQFNDFNLNKVSLFHFFNAISYGRTPWIATFETVLPRFSCALSSHHGRDPSYALLKRETRVRNGLAAISNDSCKRIIALSKCNLDMQRDLLTHFPEYSESIKSKLIVMHPPQSALVSDYSDKKVGLDGKIEFIFVGANFFRKGGMEIIETLGNLRQQYEFTLTIVSSLTTDNWATKESRNDVQRARHFIQDNSDWIDYFPRLHYQELLALMKKSHVGLLPTYADTYGFSVLECQAAGCPVITTNIRALPEINDNTKGWIIHVPKNRLGEAIYSTQEDRRIISDLIREGLERIIHEIFSDTEVILAKCKNAIAGIKEKHSVEDYANRMKEIYIQAI